MTHNTNVVSHISFNLRLFAVCVSTIEIINPPEPLLVMDGLVHSNKKREGRGQLHPAAQLLVSPVKAMYLLSQIPSACSLQSIL